MKVLLCKLYSSLRLATIVPLSYKYLQLFWLFFCDRKFYFTLASSERGSFWRFGPRTLRLKAHAFVAFSSLSVAESCIILIFFLIYLQFNSDLWGELDVLLHRKMVLDSGSLKRGLNNKKKFLAVLKNFLPKFVDLSNPCRCPCLI